MAKVWNGNSYNEDWYPVDNTGAVIGDKDWQANREWDAANAPGGAWNFSQEVAQANPVAWDQTARGQQYWNAIRQGAPATPTTGQPGGPANGQPATPLFNWDGWYTGGQNTSTIPQGGMSAETAPWVSPSDGGLVATGPAQPQTVNGVPQVQAPGLGPGYTAPQMQGASPLGQLGAIPQMDGAALLAQLGAAPEIADAGPLSQFGSDVQASIGRDLGPASVNLDDPVIRAQVDSFRRNNQRASERQRAAEAQRMNASGTLGSGGFDARVSQIAEDQGARDSDFEAQLIASELASARDRTARAQQLGAGLLSQERQQSLAERIANQQSALTGLGLQNTRDLSNQGVQQQTGLANQQAQLTGLGLQNTRDLANQGVQQQTGLANQNAALQTQGLNSGRDIASMQAGLQAQLANQSAGNDRFGLETTRNLGLNDQMIRRNALLLQQLLGQGDLDIRRLGLTNQDNQFYAGLGQQLGLDTARMNQQALMALLGM